MTKPTAPSLIAVPPDVSPEFRTLIARCHDVDLANDRLLLNAEATGKIDPACLRDSLTAYGQFRHELLTVLGEDPDSEDILPLPAEVHDT